MKILIYINEKWTDITEKVDSGFQLENRCDEVFALGSLKAWLDFDYNIPPYTPLRIDDDFYMCSSQATRYLTYDNLYVHDIQVLEATAILACFILGSKSFSVDGTNEFDRNKIKIIMDLMHQKYGNNFIWDTSDWDLFIKKQEFTFGPGTTMYDALLSIGKTYNCIPKVNIINGLLIGFYFMRLGDENTFEIIDENITNEHYSQSLDNYCETLEAEMTNVIDRTDLVSFENITPRSDDIEMTDKTAKLYLPVKIERVDKFFVHAEVKTTIELWIGYENYSTQNQVFNFMEELRKSGDVTKIGTNIFIAKYYKWAEILRVFDTASGTYIYPFDNLYDNLFKKYSIDKATIDDSYFYYNSFDDMKNGRFRLTFSQEKSPDVQVQYGLVTMGKRDITASILSKEQYDILPLKEKPKYCYYTSGTNIIDGMMESYRTDLWNIILGQSVHSFLNYVPSSKDTYILDYGVDFALEADIETYLFTTNNLDIRKCSFDVEVTTITNPFVSTKKSVPPLNQSKYTGSSRSYDKGANNIDFDKMISSLQKNNDMIGMPELALEYDLKEGNEFPKAGQKVVYKGNNWYISSVIYYYRPNRIYCIMNLVNSFSKVADVIGLETQYNTTPNPLNNIIERPLFVEVHSNVYIPNDIFFMIEIRISDRYITRFLRASVSKYENVMYLYAEALDQYSIGRQVKDYKGKDASEDSIRYAVYDISYVDTENEALKYKISVVTLPELSIEQSYKLPEYTGNYTTLLSIDEQLLYKDAREKITFTIKVIRD
ncbi:MAG: hypothetical protein NC087_04385 [Anaeroplasma bactoclasticum]|nr:hypothetical protein [Anaeroplasma bactoclasticum]